LIIEIEFKILGEVITLGKKGKMRQKAIPVVLTASLTLGMALSGGTAVLAEEQNIDMITEKISKEDAAYLFLQKEILADKKSTFSNKNVEQQLETAKSNFKIIDNM